MTRAPQRILVIDDNVDITTSLRLLLQALGHDVRVAQDGPRALVIARDYQPELVFLDLGLPRMDGYEVSRQLRTLPNGPAMKIIALTGWGDAQARELSAAAGFDQHWLKPIAINELRRYFDSTD